MPYVHPTYWQMCGLALKDKAPGGVADGLGGGHGPTQEVARAAEARGLAPRGPGKKKCRWELKALRGAPLRFFGTAPAPAPGPGPGPAAGPGGAGTGASPSRARGRSPLRSTVMEGDEDGEGEGEGEGADGAGEEQKGDRDKRERRPRSAGRGAGIEDKPMGKPIGKPIGDELRGPAAFDKVAGPTCGPRRPQRAHGCGGGGGRA